MPEHESTQNIRAYRDGDGSHRYQPVGWDRVGRGTLSAEIPVSGFSHLVRSSVGCGGLGRANDRARSTKLYVR